MKNYSTTKEGQHLTAVWLNGGFSASYDSFVAGSSAVLRMNFCAKNSQLGQAAKRYRQVQVTDISKITKTNKMMEQLQGINITSDKILFFDMDGTLVDTNFANFSAYKKALGSILKTDINLVYNPEIRFNRSLLQSKFPYLSENELNKVIRVKESLYDEFLNMNTLIDENVEVLLKYYKSNQTYLVTNCRKDRALKTLNHFGLIDKFTSIFYRKIEDNNKKVNKFKNALTILGILPHFVIAFENEEIEIADAKNAGITIINPKIL